MAKGVKIGFDIKVAELKKEMKKIEKISQKTAEPIKKQIKQIEVVKKPLNLPRN